MLLDDNPTPLLGKMLSTFLKNSVYHDYLRTDRLHHCFGSTEYVYCSPMSSLNKCTKINHRAESVAGTRHVLNNVQVRHTGCTLEKIDEELVTLTLQIAIPRIAIV